MRCRPGFAAIAVAFLAAGSVAAQAAPKSQLGTVSQLIAGTRVELIYRRPVARGRELFGTLVPWGRIWSPSSDSATRITLSTAMEVNGSELPAGTYGIWAIPDSVAWTMIFTRNAVAFHTRFPAGNDALRVKVTPSHGDHVETLQWEFPMVDADSAIVQLRWGKVVVPLRLKSKP